MSVEHFVMDLTPSVPVDLLEEVTRDNVFQLIREFGMQGPVISTDFAEDGGLFFMFTGNEDKHGR